MASRDNFPTPQNFSLLVNGTTIHCSRRVIESSSLFLDMVELELVEDSGPIPISTFITRQIMLDLVEMVEKDDRECAHLILVSLPYLLDFLIAVDFLGCENLKTVLEKKVKDKISDSNWRDVLNYIKHIPGLVNTFKHCIKFICTKMVEMAGNSLSMDPYQQNYAQFSPYLFKMMLENDCFGNCWKFRILRNWFFENREAEGEMIEMLKIVLCDAMPAVVEDIERDVKTWNIGEVHDKVLNEVIENAKKESKLKRLKKEEVRQMPMCYRHLFGRMFVID